MSGTSTGVDTTGSTVHLGDNLAVLRGLADGMADLIYVDPPFNTGRPRTYTRLRTRRDTDGDRTGFTGRRYASQPISSLTFGDVFDDYLEWLEPRLVEARRVLSPRGTLYFHIDFREVHYCKILLDGIFGRDCFLNEIIWAYDLWWPVTPALAAQARQHPRVRTGSRRLHVQRRLRRADPVHGSRAGWPGKGCAGQTADGYVVAHDRAHEWTGTNRLSDPKAPGHPQAHHRRLVVPGRVGARFSVPAAEPPVRPRTRWTAGSTLSTTIRRPFRSWPAAWRTFRVCAG